MSVRSLNHHHWELLRNLFERQPEGQEPPPYLCDKLVWMAGLIARGYALRDVERSTPSWPAFLITKDGRRAAEGYLRRRAEAAFEGEDSLALERVDGSLFGSENTGKPWTEEDDRFLLFWGPSIGIDYVAGHDLRRSLGSARRRLYFLRTERPEFYREHWRGGPVDERQGRARRTA